MGRSAAAVWPVSSQSLQVVLASNHPLVSAGLRRLLESEGMAVRGEAEDLAALHAALRAETTDICLVIPPFSDDLPAAIAATARLAPHVRVVVLSGSGPLDEDEMLGALRAGAAGWLRMDMGPERLSHALAAVRQGEFAVPRQLVGRLVDALRHREGGRGFTLPSGQSVELTAREWEILSMLAEGAASKAIARQLQISEATVRGHVAAVLHKFGVESRTEAVQYFLTRG